MREWKIEIQPDEIQVGSCIMLCADEFRHSLSLLIVWEVSIKIVRERSQTDRETKRQ